jgi:hypothetical protein
MRVEANERENENTIDDENATHYPSLAEYLHKLRFGCIKKHTHTNKKKQALNISLLRTVVI